MRIFETSETDLNDLIKIAKDQGCHGCSLDKWAANSILFEF